MRVVEVDPEATYDLRRRVLRAGRADADVRFPEDLVSGTFHLAAAEGDVVVGVASFSPASTPWRPGARAVRVRGMAVEPGRQGKGAGRRLLEAAVARLRHEGVDVLWANARDDALGFYRQLGWQVVGEGFTAAGGIPHHVALVDL